MDIVGDIDLPIASQAAIGALDRLIKCVFPSNDHTTQMR